MADYKHQNAEEGSFFCRKGDHARPISHLRMNDGQPVCKDHWDPLTGIEASAELADSLEEGARREDLARRWPSTAYANSFRGVPGITAINPSVAIGGINALTPGIIVTGVNFSSADSWTTSHPSVTVTPTLNSSTQYTLSIFAGVVPLGFYTIYFNGIALRNYFHVIN